MFFLDELKDFKLYRRKFVAPIVETNKKKGSFIYLMTPNTNSTINVLNHKLFNPKYFESLYIERDAVLFVGDASKITNEYTDTFTYSICDKGTGFINENYLRINDGENANFLVALQEDSKYDTKIRKLIWSDRIKNVKKLNELYDKIRSNVPYIHKTFYDIKRYKGFNLLIDLSYYLTLFSKNNVYKLDNGMKLYIEFITRILRNGAYADCETTKNTLVIDYFSWKSFCNAANCFELLDWKKSINPLSMIYYLLKKSYVSFSSIYPDPITIVILGKDGYFKLQGSDINSENLARFKMLIDKLDANEIDDDAPINSDEDSTKVIAMKSIEQIEKSTGIDINNISKPKYLIGDTKPTNPEPEKTVEKAKEKKIVRPIDKKTEKEIKDKIIDNDKSTLVSKVYDNAEKSNTADEAIDSIKDNEFIANIIDKIAKEDRNSTKLSPERTNRINALSKEFLNKSVNNTTVKKMIEESEEAVPIPETALKIDSINDEWNHLNFINFNKVYDPDNDIMAILNFLGTLSHPISVIDIKIEDTTTSEDYIKTYFVQCENEKGKRFQLVFDIPKIKNERFMRLRGNDKILNGQLVLLPCVKTDDDTIQLVSNYKKIFIRRFGTTTGKSSPAIDRLIKALSKYQGKDVKISWGDSSRICAKYDLPFEYVDLSSAVMKLENQRYIIYLNQDEIRSTYNISKEDIIKHEMDEEFPFAYDKVNKTIVWHSSTNNQIGDEIISLVTSPDSDFTIDNITAQSSSSKYCYSMASILNTTIPVIVVLGYTFGLSAVLKKMKNIEFTEKAPPRKEYNIGSIAFKDGYITFVNKNGASMLLNGLKDCPTEEYSLADIDDKAMWLDFLDIFGGRIKADGLDNFADLFIDPKTKAICDMYKLPNTYFDLLMYSNLLLCDNSFNRHVDLTGNRFRSNELIAGYAYNCIATAYGEYANTFKRKQTATMTMKRSAIVDAILLDPTCNDLSKETPMLEKVSADTVSFKGLSGMNSDRSYSLDKRTYDDTMINKIAMSTGTTEIVGINRQATIDMDIKDNMGTLGKTATPDDMSITKTFSITEAMNPFTATRDDPFRLGMTFFQSSKHTMRTAVSHPLLVTNGADEALPYMTSDTFSWKAKGKGKIVEKTDDYMVIKYDDPKIKSEFVDLRERVEKNSDGGFYLTIQLETDLKEGATVKPGQIVAYDHHSYSDIVGATDNIAATPGVLTKIAIPITYEGYEDSTIVTDYLSRAMESEILIKKERALDKNTNVYFLVKKGTKIQEGDPLLIYQNAYDDKDVNILLKNLAKDELGEEAVSELGRITLKSKYTGVVQDVKILRTAEISEMSDSLKKIVTAYESNIKKYKKVMQKYDTEDINAFDADYKLEPTGSLKDCADGVKIIIYIKYFDKLSVGDKLVNWAALKGVVKYIPPVGQEMYSEYRPEEEVSSMFSMDSINARMVSSIQINGAINKGLIELDRQVKEIMGIKWKTIKEYDMETLDKIENGR